MDIKDFILIGGGLLIAAVVAHGFWIAWRTRQEPLRIDIQPDLIPAGARDDDRMRGELPNGGARVIATGADPLQEDFELEPPPMLLEPAARRGSERVEPVLDEIEPSHGEPQGAAPVSLTEVPIVPEADARRAKRPSEHPGTSRQALPESTPNALTGGGDIAAPEPADAAVPEAISELVDRGNARPGQDSGGAEQERPARKTRASSRREREAADKAARAPVAAVPPQAPAEELIVMNVMCAPGQAYSGAGLFEVLRGKGLKFGEMNIFHRIEPLTKMVHYSIANVVEPGTFDMADLDSFRAPGLCLFMQLPGPEQPAAAFDDMLEVARAVSAELGGEIKDEQHNAMTPQMVAHYRQRITDFSRRRMSKRA